MRILTVEIQNGLNEKWAEGIGGTYTQRPGVQLFDVTDLVGTNFCFLQYLDCMGQELFSVVA